jgi:hypothetical protein
MKSDTDPRLSLRARGLYRFFVEVGRVIPAQELADSAAVPEGLHSVESAMKELKTFNYIKAVKYQAKGTTQWRTILKFTDETLNLFVPEFADKRISPVLSTVSTNSYSDISTRVKNIDTVTNVTVSIEAAPQTEKGIEMGWNMFEDSTPPKSKKKVLDTEDDSGAIGKVNTLKVGGARRKKTKVEVEARNRINVPEEDWATRDLVAEFYDLYIATCGGSGAVNQISGKQLATWINKRVGEGVERIHILKGMRMFFGDTRVISDPGFGLPMYQRFMKYYGMIHGMVSRVDEPIGLDEDMLAHQEKMLKLLES